MSDKSFSLNRNVKLRTNPPLKLSFLAEIRQVKMVSFVVESREAIGDRTFANMFKPRR